MTNPEPSHPRADCQQCGIETNSGELVCDACDDINTRRLSAMIGHHMPKSAIAGQVPRGVRTNTAPTRRALAAVRRLVTVGS